MATPTKTSSSQAVITFEVVKGGYVLDVWKDGEDFSDRSVVTSKAKLIKQIREALDSLEGAESEAAE